MTGFETAARRAATELGVDTDPDQLAAFLVGAQWSLDRIIALESALDTEDPSDEEVRAGAEALLADDTGQTWEESTPHQRYTYSQQARLVIQAVTDLHNTTRKK